jgi:heme/copper-type cytochrome/quinol oxidase subunit 1
VRFVVAGLIYFGFVVIEGMLMRLYEVRPLPFITEPQFFAILTGGIGMGAFMGMAGLNGMLRRTLYVNGEFNNLMILAAVSGTLILTGFLAFFYNIVMSVGLKASWAYSRPPVSGRQT